MVQTRGSSGGMTLITDAAGTVLAHPLRSALARPLREVEDFLVPKELRPGVRPQLPKWVDADTASELVVTGSVARNGEGASA